MLSNEKPLVSVGIITYNQEQYIKKCLEGVLMQQTTFPFEIVIGDDCSTDRTSEIIKEFEKKFPDIIKPIYHCTNIGATKNAYEFCFPKASGKYIALCEGDDYWTDHFKLQKQVDFLENNPDFSMCFHKVGLVDADGNITHDPAPSEKITYYTSNQLFHVGISTLSIVFRNSIKSLPNELINTKAGDIFLRGLLASMGHGANLGFVGGFYRKHAGGIYSSVSAFDQFKLSLQARKAMIKSSFFNKSHKKEIRKEYLRRKFYYTLFFLKKRSLRNCLKIALS